MSVAQAIETKLREALSPERLRVHDESHRHVGHAGARPEGETHFRVEIVAAAFANRSRLDRHRLVMTLLAEELAGRVHALSLEALSPAEVEGDRSVTGQSSPV